MYEIDFTESEKGRLDDTGLYTARLERMIEELEVEGDFSITYLSDDEIRRLNAEYRDKDEATDVLTFRLKDDDTFPDFGLSNELGISRHEAASFIETYFNRYSGVKSFVERMEEEARKNGYVRTKYGHVRDVLGINSSNKVEKAAAERVAVNTVIQGTAAEIMKSAMIAIDSAIRERNLSSRILLQVHDELIFEVPMDEKDEMEELVRTVMEGAASLSVPLRVSIETGASWGDMH